MRLENAERMVATMPNNLVRNKLLMLRKGFDVHSHSFPPTVLTVRYLPYGGELWESGDDSWPVYESLWQVREPEDPALPDSSRLWDPRFAELTAVAVIKGPHAQLIWEMARQVAVLMMLQQAETKTEEIRRYTKETVERIRPGLTLKSSNAVVSREGTALWLLNLICTIRCLHPAWIRDERGNPSVSHSYDEEQIQVDIFTASLLTFDSIFSLERDNNIKSKRAISPRPPQGHEEDKQEEILELKPGFAGVSVDVRALVRWIQRWWRSGRG